MRKRRCCGWRRSGCDASRGGRAEKGLCGMKEKISYFAAWVMMLVVFAQFAVGEVFLPFVALPGSPAWNRFIAPILIAMVATIFSFTRYKFLAAVLAAYVALFAIGDWLGVLDVWRMQEAKFVLLPDLMLALAGVVRWLMQEFDSPYEGLSRDAAD